MPEVRYQVPGVPPGPAKGITAFTPHFNRRAGSGAQDYKYRLVSPLGRYGVPAPPRDTVPSPDLGDMAQAGTSRSSDAPDMWYPQVSYQAAALEYPGAGMPIAYYSPTQPGRTTLLPVPAEDFRARYQRDSARLSRRAILNRVRQLPWYPRRGDPAAPSNGAGNSIGVRDDGTLYRG